MYLLFINSFLTHLLWPIHVIYKSFYLPVNRGFLKDYMNNSRSTEVNWYYFQINSGLPLLTRAWKALAMTSKPNFPGGGGISMGDPGGERGDTTMGEVAAESRKLPLVLSKLKTCVNDNTLCTQNCCYQCGWKKSIDSYLLSTNLCGLCGFFRGFAKPQTTNITPQILMQLNWCMFSRCPQQLEIVEIYPCMRCVIILKTKQFLAIELKC